MPFEVHQAEYKGLQRNNIGVRDKRHHDACPRDSEKQTSAVGEQRSTGSGHRQPDERHLQGHDHARSARHTEKR